MFYGILCFVSDLLCFCLAKKLEKDVLAQLVASCRRLLMKHFFLNIRFVAKALISENEIMLSVINLGWYQVTIELRKFLL